MQCVIREKGSDGGWIEAIVQSKFAKQGEITPAQKNPVSPTSAVGGALSEGLARREDNYQFGMTYGQQECTNKTNLGAMKFGKKAYVILKS
jgi:CRISPR/Cas system-associated protein Cas5 (RAMP superfamily)